MYTLNTIDRPAVVYSIDQQGGKGAANYDENVMCTILSHGTPHAVAYGIDCRNGALNEEIIPTMQAKENGGQSLNYMPPVMMESAQAKPPRRYIVRRLTPTECARLQGFPDWWTDGVSGSDSAKYKMWGNGMALPCMLAVLNGICESERANRRTCPTCAHHLGGGQCRQNAESECAEGGGFELWEKKNA